MRFSNLIALGALLSSNVVNASPLVQQVNAIHIRELVTRTTSPYVAQGCFQEGVVGGTVTAGSGLIGKEVPPSSPGVPITVEYCGTNCVGYVLFGLEQISGVTHCYCGNRLESGVVSEPAGQCDGTCQFNGVTTSCGGTLRLNVYLISGTGPAGAPGASGLVGATGTRGASGASGLPGASGLAGASGISGQNGATGVSGLPGASGLPGVSGLRGAAGSNGLNGADGAQGVPGPTGAVGAVGAPGATGVAGAPGSNGAAGTNGATGNQGVAGNNGFNGAKGAQGNPGAAGAAGAAGTNGADGSDGVMGPVGPEGAQGLQGVQGIAGPCGRAQIIDYGFEAIGTDPAYIPWQITDPTTANPAAPGGPIYDFQDQAEFHDGVRSGSVNFGAASTVTTAEFRQQHVIVCPGTAYDFSVWLFSTIPTATSCTITFNIGFPGAYDTLGVFTGVVSTGVFTEFDGGFTSTVDSDLFLSVSIDCGAFTSALDGTIYFDDFLLTPSAT